MTRIVVIGARGFFGSVILEEFRRRGVSAVASGRSRGDLIVDVENAAAVAGALRAGDLVIDTAGPFQERSLTLIRAAMVLGFDVIDLSDSAEYSERVQDEGEAIARAGIRVFTACSSLSVVSAAVIRASGIAPERLRVFLAPASRSTANRATAASLLAAISHGPIGERTMDMEQPVGRRGGFVIDSVDRVTLPRVWPGLRDCEFIVDTQVPGMNRALLAASKWPWIRGVLRQLTPIGIALSRLVGSRHGVLGFEIESAEGVWRRVFWGERSYLIAAMPAVLAAMAIAEGHFRGTGVIPADRQVDPSRLFAELEKAGIKNALAR
jgi:saccharopine dehydrogenase-like protein